MTNIATFADSLAFLKDQSAGELQIAFRTTLDLSAHRLDAWITSLATRRLDAMRDSTRHRPAHRRLRRGREPAARFVGNAEPVARQPRLRARAVAAPGDDRVGAAQRLPRQSPGRGQPVRHRPALAPRQARQAPARRPRQRPVDGGAARLSLRALAARRRLAAVRARMPARLPAAARRHDGERRAAGSDRGARRRRRRAPDGRLPHRQGDLRGDRRAGGAHPRRRRDRAADRRPARPDGLGLRPARRGERAPDGRRQHGRRGRGDDDARQAEPAAGAARRRDAAFDCAATRSASSSRCNRPTPGRGPTSAPTTSPRASSRASTPGWRACSATRRTTSSSPRCWSRRRCRATRGSRTARR